MRRTILILGVAVFLVVGLLSRTEATQYSKTHIIRNNTGDRLTTTVSTSTIIPGIHKILGYTIIPIHGSSAGSWATLYSGSMTQANIIGEAESLAENGDGEAWAYPKAVKGGGLTVVQSCYSNIFIEYTR